MSSRIQPFNHLVRALQIHIPGILTQTRLRAFNNVLEGANDKIKSVRVRWFGIRVLRYFTAQTYHQYRDPPLHDECPSRFSDMRRKRINNRFSAAAASSNLRDS